MTDRRPRRLVIHADDLGFSRSTNAGIREAAVRGCLASTSLLVNGPAFDEAVSEVVPECPGLGLGVHLNLTEGTSTRDRVPSSSRLCDRDGVFRTSFVRLLRGQRDRTLLDEVEREMRCQIERALETLPRVDHLNSHEHVHAVPALFELTCRLALEYGVPYVRLPREHPFMARPVLRLLRGWYGLNVVKLSVLRKLCRRNSKVARELGVSTNDWFVGVLYTGHMDGKRAVRGVAALGDREGLLEVLLHPARVTVDGPQEIPYPSLRGRDYALDPLRLRELEALLDPELPERLRNLGWELSCFACAPEVSNIHDHPSRSPEPEPPPTRPPLKALAIVDETTFYHPEYVRRLIDECGDVEVVAAALVRVKGGSQMQHYLMRNLRRLGVWQFLRLALKRILLIAAGLMPRAIRGEFDASVRAVLKRFAVQHRVVSAVNTQDFLDWARSIDPDLIISSNSLIFKDPLLELPRVAAINRHSALLPSYGGVLPVFRAIQKGELWTGASVHYMTPRIDEGGVLSRKWVPIHPGDTLETLYRLCFTVSYEATAEAIGKLRHSPNAESIDPQGLVQSYYTFPTPEDWEEFHARGGRFI